MKNILFFLMVFFPAILLASPPSNQQDGLSPRDFQRLTHWIWQREKNLQKQIRLLKKQKRKLKKKLSRKVSEFPPYSLLSDFIPPAGEDKVKASLYSRWQKHHGTPSPSKIKKFITQNFILRDGTKWAGQNGLARINLEKGLERIMSAQVVFFGEQHNQAGDHLLEILLLNLLLENNKNTTVVMEIFERQTQTILNSYLGGKISEAQFIKRLKSPSIKGLWSNYLKDYRPVVERCKQGGIPIVAGFPPRKFAATIARKGVQYFYHGLAKKNWAPRRISIPGRGYRKDFVKSFDSMNAVVRAMFLKMIQKSPQKAGRMKKMLQRMESDQALKRMFLSQCFKDSTMAEGILAQLKKHPRRKIYVIVGAGHTSYDRGVVDLLKRARPNLKIVTITNSHPRVASREKEKISDLIFFSDSIETYISSYPKGISKKEFRQGVEVVQKMELLKLYRKNDSQEEKAMRLLEKERGLKFKYPVSCRIMTDEEANREVTSWSKGEDLSKKELVLKAFKLIPSKIQLSKEGTKHRKSSIMGFYRPSTKYLYIFPSKAGRKTWGLRVHESAHALQDQWFDLGKLEKKETTPDREFGLTALIEGEAVYLMMRVLGMGSKMKKMLHGSSSSKKKGGYHSNSSGYHSKKTASSHSSYGKKKGPLTYYQLRTIFFYRKGAQFISYLVKRGGWKSVSQAFGNLPITTSEILHPEQYIRGFRPEKISLPKRQKGWKTVQKGDLGEANLLILLRLKGLSSEKALEITRFWRGDGFSLSQSKKSYHLLYGSVWKNTKAAGRMVKWLAKIFPKSQVQQKGKKVLLSRTFVLP